MGAPRRDAGRGANEVERPVRLARAFYMATTEVTNAQFRQFTQNHESGQAGGKSLNREHQPAVRSLGSRPPAVIGSARARGCRPFIPSAMASSQGWTALRSDTVFRLRLSGRSLPGTREDIWRFAWGEACHPRMEAPTSPTPLPRWSQGVSSMVTQTTLW